MAQKKGWIKFNYVNRSEIDLKTHLNVIEINNDLERKLTVDGVFVSIGQTPNTNIFNDLVPRLSLNPSFWKMD